MEQLIELFIQNYKQFGWMGAVSILLMYSVRGFRMYYPGGGALWDKLDPTVQKGIVFATAAGAAALVAIATKVGVYAIGSSAIAAGLAAMGMHKASQFLGAKVLSEPELRVGGGVLHKAVDTGLRVTFNWPKPPLAKEK